MGLIKAALGSVGGTLADQWKEYYICEGLEKDTLVVKGVKKTGKRSSNKRGSNNVITDGSVIAVNEGQCMIIVENGKVIELSAEPGAFIYNTSLEPTIFEGNLSDGIKNLFDEVKQRFQFGGEASKDQRIYYVNTKEIVGNKYGTSAPIPFRVIDENAGINLDISLRAHGEYSYKITNPILFYQNVCGNVEEEYMRDEIDSQLKAEFLTALQPAFAKISDIGIRYSSIPAHTTELADALNKVLSSKWSELRGINVVSVAVESITAPESDVQKIQELQFNAAFKNPQMAAAQMVGAQSAAMQNAAKNENGAMAGFMGMGVAQNMGGINAQQLYMMGQIESKPNNNQPNAQWKCLCGAINGGKFCSACGSPKPMSDAWVCSCGATNSGKFCSNCGSAKPVSDTWVCSCGTTNSNKFCSNCGSPKK